jgi:hypothetical protein
MKHMMKRLAAIALAGAMVLSLSVTALADDPERDHLVDQNGANDTNTAKGEAQGAIRNQGTIPDPVIKVKLPTTAANVFDVYIDPHNLIQESSAAMFTEDASAFATDTLVYFKNNGDTVTYSKTSDDIKIVNKSSVPVSVEMEAKWDKAAATYSLAKDAADLAASKAAGDAALYLYMKDSMGNEAAVVEKDKGTPVLTFGVEKSTVADENTATTDVAASKLSNLPKFIKSVKFEWTAAADAQDMKLINEGETGKTPTDWAFTFTGTAKKTPTVAFDVSKLPNYTTLSGTTLNTNNTYKTVAAPAVNITETLNMDGSKTYSVDGGKAVSVLKLQKGTTDIALITFEWDYEAIGANSYEIKEKAKNTSADTTYTTYVMKLTGASGEGAKFTTDVNRTDGAYTLQKNSAGNALEWKLGDTFTDDTAFHSLSFNLTGAITDGDVCAKAWDTAFPTTVTNATLDVTWKVYACDAVDPSVEVTTAIGSSGSAQLKVDWGFGDKKTTAITAASYVDGNGVTQALNVDNEIALDATDKTLVTVTPSNSAQFNSGDGKVTFTFTNSSTGYTTNVVADLKTANA